MVITLAYAFCSVGFFVFYKRFGDRRLKCLTTLFFLFVLDNLYLYMNEFLPSFSGFYAQMMEKGPIIGLAFSFAICLCYRRTTLAYIDKKSRPVENALWILGGTALAFSMVIYNTPLGQALDFAVHNTISLTVFVLALNGIKKNGTFIPTPGVPELPIWLVFSGLVLQTTRVVERILEMNSIKLLPSRYVSIELIGALFALTAIVFIAKEFNRLLSADRLDNQDTESGELSSGEKELDLQEFGASYKLTAREQDILIYLIRGYSVSQICEEACIAQGTVKKHTYNIYQKVDVKNRVQLLTKINEFRYKPN